MENNLMDEMKTAHVLVMFWDGKENDAVTAESLAAMSLDRKIILLRPKGVSPDFPPSLLRKDLVKAVVEYRDLRRESEELRERIISAAEEVLTDIPKGSEIHILSRSSMRDVFLPE